VTFDSEDVAPELCRRRAGVTDSSIRRDLLSHTGRLGFGSDEAASSLNVPV
jgi:hypothetical protein